MGKCSPYLERFFFAVLVYLPFALILSCNILMRQRPHGLGMFAESRLLSEWCRLPYLLRQSLRHYFVVSRRSLTIMSTNKPSAPNPARASLLHAGRYWREVGEPGRYADECESWK